MSTVRTSLNFLRSIPAEKILTGDNVIAGISANATLFTNLPVPVTELQDVNYKLQKAAADAKSRDKTTIKVFKAALVSWNSKLRSTAAYVGYVANGNEEIIIKAGFTPTKSDRKRRQRAAMLNGLKAAPGTGKGTCIVSCKGEKGVDGYVCVAAPDTVKASMNGDTLVLEISGETVYIKTSGKKNVELDSLPSSKPICISMYSFNSAGSGPLAPSIEMTPQ